MLKGIKLFCLDLENGGVLDWTVDVRAGICCGDYWIPFSLVFLPCDFNFDRGLSSGHFPCDGMESKVLQTHEHLRLKLQPEGY